MDWTIARLPITTVICLAALLAATSCTSVHAREIFVAPDGDDANSGTETQPRATHQAAIESVRAGREAGDFTDEPVVIVLREGDYRVEESIAVTAADSGSEGARLTIRAHPDERARLIGGPVMSADDFQPVTDDDVLARIPEEAREHVVQANLSDFGVGELKQWPDTFRGYAGWPELFFNGQPMQLARWPNEGYAEIAEVLERGSVPRHGDTDDRPGVFRYSGERPERWQSAPEVYLNGYWCFKWYDEVIRVGEIDPENDTITMAAPHHYGVGGRSGGLYYAMGLLEELDLPGEYHVDRQNGLVYFYPPEAMEGVEIGLSTLNETMITVEDASYVTLRDLTLEFSQARAISVTGGEANEIAGCTVRNMARNAMTVSGGSNHLVTGCNVSNMGQSGITMSGGDRATLTPSGHEVVNNHVHHFSRLVSTYAPGISIRGVGCRAAHNLIHDAPHMGMGFSGNEHVIELNHIHHVCMDTDDAGAIYTGRDWTQRGTAIRHNFFHHLQGGPSVSNQAVYLDDMYSGTTVHGNVIYAVPRAMLIGGGRANILENNVMIDCPQSIRLDNRGMGWATPEEGDSIMKRLGTVPYQEEPWATRYPHLVNILDEDPGVPKYNVVRLNVTVNSGDLSISKPAVEFGTVEDNLSLEEDPGFENAAQMNFALEPDSIIYERLEDFQPIPFEDIGLYVDEYRPSLPVSEPVINPESRAFVGELQVELSPSPRGAESEIHYTLDGGTPTADSPRYDGPITITENTTLRAIAINPDRPEAAPSSVVSASYEAMQLGEEGGVYLSDLPAENVIAHGGLKKDTNYKGNAPITLDGEQYQKGLLLHPTSTDQGNFARAGYELSDGLSAAVTFSAVIGVDDAVGERGSVEFVVEVLRDGEWQRVFESDVLHGGESQPIELSVAGAEKLRLLTGDGGDDMNADHAVFADAKLQ